VETVATDELFILQFCPSGISSSQNKVWLCINIWVQKKNGVYSSNVNIIAKGKIYHYY
jgi:hypothetical protein